MVQAGSSYSQQERGKGMEETITVPPPLKCGHLCVILEVDTSILHSTGQNLSHMVKSSRQGGKEAGSCAGQP